MSFLTLSLVAMSYRLISAETPSSFLQSQLATDNFASCVTEEIQAIGKDL